MIKNIPRYILDVYKKMETAGYEIYFVGGCVRNLLMELPVKDWDLTTSATPEEILKIFPNGFYDNTFGTVGIPIEVDRERKIVEITTYRTEQGYSDKRRPDKVEWGKTIEEDLERRDFTINAIALKCHSEPRNAVRDKLREESKKIDASATPQHDIKYEIVDPYGGQKDIEQKLIRAVGDPALRFKEDALRLMRAVRFASTLSFSIEPKTLEEITKDAKNIVEISGERIRDELLKILASDFPYDGAMLLRNTTLLEHILPELTEGVGISQARPGRHHTEDVFTHNVLSLKFCPSTKPIVRLAALSHDIGKSRVIGKDEEGLVIFHNHEIVGANMAKAICDRLHFSKKDREKVVTLIRWHMFTVDEKITDAAVRRFIRRIGVDNVEDMMDLRIGDRLGGGTQTAESWRLKLFRKRVEEQLQPAPFSINDLAIDGNDIMKELNMKPGPKIGEILQKLFEEVDEDLSKNTKDYLTKRLKEVS